MPDTTAPAGTPAAEVATAPATPDGATPPPAVAAADKRMSEDSARKVLQGLRGGTPEEQEQQGILAALSDDDGTDVLTNEGDTIEDVLGYVPDESQAQDEPAAEEQQVDPTAEAAQVDDAAPPAVELTDERVRTNINRKKADGTFVHGERTRAALTLSHEQQIDYEDAYARLFGERTATQKSEAAQAEPAKPEPTPAEIDAQIADLRVKRKEARDSINDTLADELNDQINDLVLGKSEAIQRESQRQQAQREAQGTVAQQTQQSIARASGLYPDAAVAGTPLHAAMAADLARMEQANSPILSDPEWPELLAAKHASRLGIAPKAKAVVAKPGVKPAAVAPTRKATPLPSPGSVSGNAPAVDARADWQARLEKAKAARDSTAVQALMREAVTLERRRAA